MNATSDEVEGDLRHPVVDEAHEGLFELSAGVDVDLARRRHAGRCLLLRGYVQRQPAAVVSHLESPLLDSSSADPCDVIS